MVSHGESPFLECSSQGDARLSAFYARIKARGNRSIEEIYQGSKIFEGNISGMDWKFAKGRTPLNPEEVRVLYSQLWDEYIKENPKLYAVIREASGLSDKFGQQGHACQATELWRIRNDPDFVLVTKHKRIITEEET
jgi:hypothetical protein